MIFETGAGVARVLALLPVQLVDLVKVLLFELDFVQLQGTVLEFFEVKIESAEKALAHTLACAAEQMFQTFEEIMAQDAELRVQP